MMKVKWWWWKRWSEAREREKKEPEGGTTAVSLFLPSSTSFLRFSPLPLSLCVPFLSLPITPPVPRSASPLGKAHTRFFFWHAREKQQKQINSPASFSFFFSKQISLVEKKILLLLVFFFSGSVSGNDNLQNPERGGGWRM